jgi:hypothetical protein
MAYIGTPVQQALTKVTSQSFNGTGSQTVFTLNRAVNTGEELEVFVNNVQQEPGVGKSYTATGTTLTFDAAPSSGTGNIYVIYRGLAEVTRRLEHDPNQALAATTGTFSGDLTVDTNTLYVDSTNNRIGMGISPLYALHTSTSSGVNRFESTAATGEAVIHTFNRDGQTAYIGKENSAGSYTFASGGVADAFAIAHYGSTAPIQIGHNTPELIIDSSGRVTMPYQPSFRAESGPLGYTTTSPIPFSSVQHNVGSHYSTITNRFTAPIAGVYALHLHVGFVRINSGSGWAQTELRRNGAQLAYSYFQGPTATAYAPASVSVLTSLSANDYIEAIFQHSNGQYYANARELQFSGYLVG